MNKNIRYILILALILSACAAPAAATPQPGETQAPAPQPTETAAPVEVADGRGKVFILAAPAQRIVSLAPSNTEILFALGAGGQVVGRDEFSDYPAEALQITNIGGGWGEIDQESVLALAPDLVLAADIIAPEQIQMLEDLGLPVFVLPNPVVLEDLYPGLRTMGMLTGRQSEAEALITSLQARMAEVENILSGAASRPLVFYDLDATEPNAPWTAGTGTFIDAVITAGGGNNLGSTLEGAYVQVSLEELLVQDPDIIILGDATWGGVTPEAVAARAGWTDLSAVKNSQVIPFDDNLVSRPGPRLVDAVEQMARLFHPDLFD